MKVEGFLPSFIIIIISELLHCLFWLAHGTKPDWGSERTKACSKNTPESLGTIHWSQNDLPTCCSGIPMFTQKASSCSHSGSQPGAAWPYWNPCAQSPGEKTSSKYFLSNTGVLEPGASKNNHLLVSLWDGWTPDARNHHIGPEVCLD